MPSNEQKPRSCEECEEVQKDVADMKKQISSLDIRYSRISEAFVKNDLGAPDFDGHRVAHGTAIEQSKVVAGYKRDLTKRVLEWMLVAVAVLIGQGAMEWIKGHIK